MWRSKFCLVNFVVKAQQRTRTSVAGLSRHSLSLPVNNDSALKSVIKDHTEEIEHSFDDVTGILLHSQRESSPINKDKFRFHKIYY